MAKPRIKWNLAAFQEIRRRPEVGAMLGASAQRISQAAGGAGYEAQVSAGQTRTRASVVTSSPESMRENAQRNTLVRAVDAGRL